MVLSSKPSKLIVRILLGISRTTTRFSFLLTFPILALLSTVTDARIFLTPELSDFNAAPHIEYLIVEDDTYTIDAVSHGQHSDKFKTNGEKLLNLSGDFNAYWIRFRFQAPNSDKLPDWFLYFSGPPLPLENGYLIYSNGRPLALGDTWDSLSPTEPVFRLTLSAGDTLDLYLKTDKLARSIYTVYILDAEEVVAAKASQFLLRGLYIGATLIMFFYNLFIYLRIREPAYLYYCAFIIAAGTAFAALDGTLTHYFSTNDDESTIALSLSLFMVSEITYLLFLCKLLDVAKFSLRLYKMHLAIVAFVGLGLILFQTTHISFGIPLFYLCSLIFASFTLTSLIYLTLKKLKHAKVALISFTLPILFTTTTALTYFDIYTFTHDFSIFGTKFTLMAAFAMLSLVLASKFSSLKERNISLKEQAISNLEASDKMKREFLSTISHELRTPMNGVKASLELMRLESKEDCIKPYIDTVDESANHMMSLIDGILNFIDLESGHIKAKSSEFNLNQLLEDVAQPYEALCQAKGIQFTFLSGLSHDWYSGDEGKLNQILTNLLDNATKFCSDGYVSLTAEEQNINDENKIVFKIKDTGIGIPPDKQKDIFKLFYQADGSYTRSFGGLGIGLTITKELVETLGGTINFTSVDEIGTEFTVSIPMQTVPHEEATEESSGHSQSIRTPNNTRSAELAATDKALTPDLTILIVEDNHVNQKVLNALVTKLGHTTALCENGQEAVEWCKQHRADLIFMDCQMPVMDGFEATQQIRSKGSINNNTPIIAVTANVSEQDREKCFSSGMDDFISKPVKKAGIDAAIRKWTQCANDNLRSQA